MGHFRSDVIQPSWVLIPQHFGCLVYGKQSSQYIPFDHEATALLHRLVDEPFTKIVDSSRQAGVRRMYARFHEQFHRLGFFTLEDRFAGTVLSHNPPADHLAGPLTVHLEVTKECNLSCRHCFSGGNGLDNGKLSLDEMDSLFGEMAALGVFRLGLTGGEPLLRSDLFDIIDRATAHGLSPCLTTNGLLIDDHVAAELGRRPLAWLNVSLEGASAESHDSIRGRGTFELVLERLAVLRRHSSFSLAFTVMRHNLQEVRACVELAQAVGARAAVFRPLYPVGRALIHEDLQLDFDQYNRALAELAALGPPAGLEYCNLHPFGPELRRDCQSTIFTNFGCGAGNSTCSVSSSGNVSPCSFLGPEFVGGSLRRQCLRDIWNESDVFRKIRAIPSPLECSICANFDRCRGGCRARALALTNTITAPDPWCAMAVGC